MLTSSVSVCVLFTDAPYSGAFSLLLLLVLLTAINMTICPNLTSLVELEPLPHSNPDKHTNPPSPAYRQDSGKRKEEECSPVSFTLGGSDTSAVNNSPARLSTTLPAVSQNDSPASPVTGTAAYFFMFGRQVMVAEFL